MKILVITSAPLFPTNTGYKRSVVGRIAEWKREGNEIVIIQVNNESIKKSVVPVDLPVPGIQLFEVTRNKKRTVFEEFLSVFSYKTRHESLFSESSVKSKIESYIYIHKPDYIVAESIWCISAISAHIKTKIHLVVHDVSVHYCFEMIKSSTSLLKKTLYFFDWLKLLYREKHILVDVRIGKITFLTKEDMQFYINNYTVNQEMCNVASNMLLVRELNRSIDFTNPFILFPGSVDFSQNHHALKWFCKNVLPFVVLNKIKIYVTGAASERNRKFFCDYDVIQFTGEIDSNYLTKLYESCLCVIAPITTGTGLKIKILEATQQGVPVVTTKFASKGIQSNICMYGQNDSPESFALILNEYISKIMNS